MYLWICLNFDSTMVNFPVRLLIFFVWYWNRKVSPLIWRALRWDCGSFSPSSRPKEITRFWDSGTSPPSWVNTTTIRRSNPLSLFVYVLSLTCDFGDFYEEMVVSLTRWTLSDLDNTSFLFFCGAFRMCFWW